MSALALPIDRPLRVLDLFSGIGGMALGLDRAGMETVAFCEIEPYAAGILRKHWPTVPIFMDIRNLTPDRLRNHGLEIDVIAGGFPCQDISYAGRGAGLKGNRSGLWQEFARLIREVRPRLAIIENVPALRTRGLAEVLGQLAEIGFDAEWHCIPASALGAPHRRDRIFILAYPHGLGWQGSRRSDLRVARTADQNAPGCDPGGQIVGSIAKSEWWAAEPDVARMVYGVPRRVDRIRCLGNAIIPQIAEMIGRAILGRPPARRPFSHPDMPDPPEAIMGVSPISRARQTIGLKMAAENASARGKNA